MQSAILSPAFRVREFAVKDSQPYRIKLAWGSVGNSEGGLVIFLFTVNVNHLPCLCASACVCVSWSV